MHLHKNKSRKEIIAEKRTRELLRYSFEETLIPHQKIEFYNPVGDPFYFEDEGGNAIERIATTTFSLNGKFSIPEQKHRLNLLEKTVIDNSRRVWY